ncbi:WD40 repeat domain-containing protein [Streptomyces sp. NPDC048191]|uniref:WD40 repeat domain-containing protein n=1 Tax=Streptomyces sp. NPDC048191 TaxID=3155484 RepID=UPI0033DC552C
MTPTPGDLPRRLWFREEAGDCGGLSPDGTVFLRSGAGTVDAVDDGGRTIWSAAAGGPGPVSAVWAADADEVLVFPGGSLGRALDALTGAERFRFRAVPGTAGRAVAVAPDGLRTAVLSDPATVTIRHRRTGATVHLSVGDRVADLVWDPGGRLLGVATTTALQLWNPATRSPHSTPCSGRTGLRAVAWSPDRRTLALADAEGVHLADAQGTAVPDSSAIAGVYGLGFSRTGRFLAVATARGVLVVDRTLKKVADIPAAPRTGADFGVCAAGRLLVRTEHEGRVGYALWELPDAGEPSPGRRADAAVRRWVAAMCGSVGRRVPVEGGTAALTAGPARPFGTGASAEEDAEEHAQQGDQENADDGRDAGGQDAARQDAARQDAARQDAEEGGVHRPLAPGFAWLGVDATVAESRPGLLALTRPGVPQPVWTAAVPTAPWGAVDIEPSAEALDPVGASVFPAALAVATRQGATPLTVLDAVTGSVLNRCPGGQAPVWCPTGGGRLVVPEPGRRPAHLYLYDFSEPSSPARPVSRPVPRGVGRPAWSPDGSRLAAGTLGEVLLWRMPEFTRSSPRLTLPSGAFATRVAWSPDGSWLAATPEAGRGPIVVWDTVDWQIHRELGAPGGVGWAPALAWSPDGRLLAAPGPGRSPWALQIWDVAEGSVLLTLEPAPVPGPLWAVRWSPDGRRLVTTYGGGTVLVWELRSARAASAAVPLPLPPPRLAELGGAAAAAEAAVPLSVLAELTALLGPSAGDRLTGAAGLLYGARAAEALRALSWPPAAHPALAAVTASQLPPDVRFAAPSGVPAAELRTALRRGLAGADQEVPELGPSVGELAAALERTRTGLLPALRLLGPDAVRQDPGLVHRVARGLGRPGPALDGRHPVAGLRLTMSPVGDEITGPTTAGDPAELVRHGPPDRMVPSQLALPDDVLAALYAQDALLYRTRSGAAPPATRNAVLVLDTGPAAHGRVGTCLRVCAHALADALAGAGRQVELVRLDGRTGPVPLTGPTGLRRLWQAVPPAPPDPVRAAELTTGALTRLAAGTAGAPRAVLLTHPHQPRLGVPGLLTIRVHYPGVPAPTTEAGCWTLAPDPAPDRLTDVLASVLAEL